MTQPMTVLVALTLALAPVRSSADERAPQAIKRWTWAMVNPPKLWHSADRMFVEDQKYERKVLDLATGKRVTGHTGYGWLMLEGDRSLGVEVDVDQDILGARVGGEKRWEFEAAILERVVWPPAHFGKYVALAFKKEGRTRLVALRWDDGKAVASVDWKGPGSAVVYDATGVMVVGCRAVALEPGAPSWRAKGCHGDRWVSVGKDATEVLIWDKKKVHRVSIVDGTVVKSAAVAKADRAAFPPVSLHGVAVSASRKRTVARSASTLDVLWSRDANVLVGPVVSQGHVWTHGEPWLHARAPGTGAATCRAWAAEAKRLFATPDHLLVFSGAVDPLRSVGCPTSSVPSTP